MQIFGAFFVKESNKKDFPDGEKTLDILLQIIYTRYIRKQKGLFPQKLKDPFSKYFLKKMKKGLDISVFF